MRGLSKSAHYSISQLPIAPNYLGIGGVGVGLGFLRLGVPRLDGVGVGVCNLPGVGVGVWVRGGGGGGGGVFG